MAEQQKDIVIIALDPSQQAENAFDCKYNNNYY